MGGSWISSSCFLILVRGIEGLGMASYGGGLSLG